MIYKMLSVVLLVWLKVYCVAGAGDLGNVTQLFKGVHELGIQRGSVGTTASAGFAWDVNARKEMDPSRVTEALNKRVVLGFLNEFFGDKNIPAAEKYISSEKYIQHNPGVADGLKAVTSAAVGWFDGLPKEKMDIRRISAEGDLVWAHYRTIEEGKLTAVIDIFRLENGKIVEHWDVIQPIPEVAQNDHPMF